MSPELTLDSQRKASLGKLRPKDGKAPPAEGTKGLWFRKCLKWFRAAIRSVFLLFTVWVSAQR